MIYNDPLQHGIMCSAKVFNTPTCFQPNQKKQLVCSKQVHSSVHQKVKLLRNKAIHIHELKWAIVLKLIEGDIQPSFFLQHTERADEPFTWLIHINIERH